MLTPSIIPLIYPISFSQASVTYPTQESTHWHSSTFSHFGFWSKMSLTAFSTGEHTSEDGHYTVFISCVLQSIRGVQTTGQSKGHLRSSFTTLRCSLAEEYVFPQKTKKIHSVWTLCYPDFASYTQHRQVFGGPRDQATLNLHCFVHSVSHLFLPLGLIIFSFLQTSPSLWHPCVNLK